MQEINKSCPSLRTMKCGDTKEHRHLFCKSKRELITNSEATSYCITDGKWILCAFYELEV